MDVLSNTKTEKLYHSSTGIEAQWHFFATSHGKGDLSFFFFFFWGGEGQNIAKSFF